jgi:hypothetical protein
MEQVMGGRYTARGMWGERRKHRRSEEMRSSGGLSEMRKESDIRMGWQLEIADCAILGIVVSFVSFWFCLLPRSGGSLCI